MSLLVLLYILIGLVFAGRHFISFPKDFHKVGEELFTGEPTEIQVLLTGFTLTMTWPCVVFLGVRNKKND
jgi:hypothetical protein